MAATLGALAIACGDGTLVPVPATIARRAGDHQAAVIGSAVATPPSVLVSDASGAPLPGVAVVFAVAAGGGSVAGGSTTTDPAGIAAVGRWTLGSTFGTNTMTATVAGLPSVSFTAAGTAAAMQIAAGDAQSATVGSVVVTPPSVRLLDGAGSPVPGAPVVFSVITGQGVISHAVDTSDAAGVAAIGSWTLGHLAGSNTIVATVTGLPTVLFTATGLAGAAELFIPVGGDGLSAPVASALSVPPTTQVTDGYGNPVSGVVVTFIVAAGGGSLTGTTATTNSSGIGRVGSWVLGSTIGTNSVLATAAPGSLEPLVFTATARAGPPASLAKQAGDGQTTVAGTVVAVRPAVLVMDGYGNPVAGLSTTFSVTSGGGNVTGGAAITNAAGIATVGDWELGTTSGTNTLAASVTGMPAVIFTASAVNPCVTGIPYTIGSSVTGALTVGDCKVGDFLDLYTTTIAGTVSARIDYSSPSFYPDLTLSDGAGAEVGYAGLYCDCGPVSARVLLGPGNYVAALSGHTDYGSGNTLGAYALASAIVPEDVARCEQVFITPGVATAQRVERTDCVSQYRSTNYYSDNYLVHLTAGRTYTIIMSSADFDSYLELWYGGVAASNDDFGGTSNSQVVFTPTETDFYGINAATYPDNVTGNYTLTIAVAPSPVSRPAAPRSPALVRRNRSLAPIFQARPPKS